MLSKYLPGFGLTNIKVVYLIVAVMHGWFTAAIWLFFFQDTVTNTQVGVIFVVSLAVLVSAELPSGVLSDLIGHRRVLILAAFLSSFGNLLTFLNTGFWSLLIAVVVFFLGSSFYSGALEAFVFESFKEAGEEESYDSYLAVKILIRNSSKLLATLIGSLVFLFARGAPFLLLAITHLIAGIALVTRAIEPDKDVNRNAERVETSWFKQLKQTVGSRQWIPVVLLGTVVAAIATVVGWGPFELSIATESGLDETNIFLVLIPVFLAQAIAGGYYSKVLGFVGGPVKGLYLTAIAVSLGYLILSFGMIVTLIVGFVAMRILGDYMAAFVLSYVQERLAPEVRASVLSVISLLRWAVIAVAALLAGIAADNGWILQLSLYISVLVPVVIVIQRTLSISMDR